MKSILPQPFRKSTACAHFTLIAIVFAVMVTVKCGQTINAQTLQPVTVADAVRLRLFNPLGSLGPQLELSPDGHYVAYMLGETNLEKNLNEMVLYIVPTDSARTLSTLGRGREIARVQPLSSFLRGGPSRANSFKWQADGSGIFLLNQPIGESRAVISRIDIKTAKSEIWYRSGLDIEQFAITEKGDQVAILGRRVVTDKPARLDSQRGIRMSPDESFRPDELEKQRERPYEYGIRVIRRGHPEEIIYRADQEKGSENAVLDMTLSPDGRWLTFLQFGAKAPETWKADPYYQAGAAGRVATRLIDLRGAATTAKLSDRIAHDAPNASIKKWSDDSSSYLVWARSPVGDGLAVREQRKRWSELGNAELNLYSADAETGKESIVLPGFSSVAEYNANGLEDVIAFDEHASRIVLRLKSGHLVTFRRQDGGKWKETQRVRLTKAGSVRGSGAVLNENLVVYVDESPSVAPDLYSADIVTGTKIRLTEVNPELRDQKLGKIEKIEWNGKHGELYRNYLVYPVDYFPGKRYPCVIMLSGWDDKFKYTAGWNTFPIQPLAASGIFVLLARSSSENLYKGDFATKRYYVALMAYGENTLNSAKAELDRRGLIDPNRVGLMGFSHSGKMVHHAISNGGDPSKPPAWKAAVFADSDLPEYSQYFTWGADHRRGYMHRSTYGGPPFGEYRKEWEENAPSFTANRVRTPLMMLTHGNWGLPAELMTALQMQGKPVDLIWYPAERGTLRGMHNLKTPTERETSIQREVDWFGFWLQDYERTKPAPRESREELEAQYSYWHKLREQHKWNEKLIAEGKDPATEYMREIVKRDVDRQRSEGFERQPNRDH